MNRLVLTVAIIVLTTLPALAGKVKTITFSSAAHHDKAQFQQVVVSNEGTVRLARWAKPMEVQGEFDPERVWDIVEDKAGNLIVATGDHGKIWRVAPDGVAKVIFDSTDSQILCLMATPDGVVYAGTGPNGLIVRIDPAGSARVHYDSPESYIWSLAYDHKTQAVFAATGPRGRILRVGPDGQATVFFQCRQDHVLSLARAADGNLYAGTDKQGLVYRINPQGKGFVLFQANQAEVRCLHLADNAIYVGTSSTGSTRGGSGSSERSGGGVSQISRTGATAVSTATVENAPLATTIPRERDKDSEKPTAAIATGSPASSENSVYRIGFDGSTRELFREKGLILSLLKIKDRLLVGMGSKGQLFEIRESTRERSEIARLDHGQVNRLYQRRDGSIVLAAGDPGKLFSLHDRHVGKGMLISDVIDAKLPARWGTLNWHADVPEKTTLSVSVRAGNVAEPDETWTGWSAEMTDAASATALVPPSRYLQYRVSFATDEPTSTPALRHFSVRCATLNQPPEISAIDVGQPDPGSKDPKKLKLKWTASDANDDELVFDIFVKKDGWKDWVRIEEGWSKSEYEWDTAGTPSGMYQVKIVASDRTDNSEREALVAERLSSPVPVAHEPPTVTLKFVGVEHGKARFEGRAEGGLSRLAGASFAVNSGKWSNVFPSDGLFDGRTESFRFSTEQLRPGAYVLMLKVRDASGNSGSADVAFRVEE